MLKIIDVDLYADYILELTFSDGYSGYADLSEFFAKPPFSQVKDFQKFSLTPEGTLNWNGNEIPASVLREMLVSVTKKPVPVLNIDDIESVIKQASWESMQEGRPDILQAAIRSYVEYFGHNDVIKVAGIKSRTSAYRSLKPEITPNYGTLVQLGYAIIKIAKSRMTAIHN